MAGRGSNLKKQVKKALESPTLQVALRRSVDTYRKSREKTLESIDFASLRKELRKVKEEAIENLPSLIEEFRTQAEKVAAKVFLAEDAAQANNYLVKLAKERGATLAVKSKSMTTEEIDLNEHLAQIGVRAVETDLGQWIVQLAGERPSHMSAPAIHKSREEVAKLFSKVVGHSVPPDIKQLVRVARKELRQIFIDADLGISGANASIARTGTLVIVTNEGNGRLVTTLPPVHAAVVGIEKILPSLDEATLLLKILAPSCMGMPFTSYVSFITGPSRTGDIELTTTLGVHGPEEVHIVLLDNGRSALRDDPEFREALYCIKCSACLTLCPVFQAVGGHAFGHIYPGGIGAILTAFLHGWEEASDPAQLCMGCQRCVDICPTAINIPRMIVALRERLVQQRGLPRLESLIFHRVLPHRERFHRLVNVASNLQRPLAGRDSLIRSLPIFSSLVKQRSLPAVTKQPLRSRLVKDEETLKQPTLTVNLYAGCLIDFLYPDIGAAIQEVLRAQNVETLFAQTQTCCGVPPLYQGDRETALELARQNIAALESEEADYVLTACPTCGEALRREYPRLFQGDEAWEKRAQALAEKTRDFSEFLVDELKIVGKMRVEGQTTSEAVKIAYHDPCHLKHGLGIYTQPRKLLTEVGGYQLQEMPEADLCCGFAGSFSLKFPQVSGNILKRKLDAIESNDVQIIATDCPGCILQLRGGLDKAKSPIEVRHTAELLARRLHRENSTSSG